MVVVAMRRLLRCAGIRRDGREAVQTHVRAQQRTEKFEQKIVGEDVRPAEGAGHAQGGVVTRTPHPDVPVRRRLRRLGFHGGQIQPSELRDILAMHGLDGGGRKRSTQQDAAVLLQSRTGRGLGLRAQAPRRRSRSPKRQRPNPSTTPLAIPHRARAGSCLKAYAGRPWHCLYFLPEPHGHGSLRPTLPQLDGSSGLRAGPTARRVAVGSRAPDCEPPATRPGRAACGPTRERCCSPRAACPAS